MYFLIYLKRHVRESSNLTAEKTVEYIMLSLERNFGGVMPSDFSKVLDCFKMVRYT